MTRNQNAMNQRKDAPKRLYSHSTRQRATAFIALLALLMGCMIVLCPTASAQRPTQRAAQRDDEPVIEAHRFMTDLNYQLPIVPAEAGQTVSVKFQRTGTEGDVPTKYAVRFTATPLGAMDIKVSNKTGGNDPIQLGEWYDFGNWRRVTLTLAEGTSSVQLPFEIGEPVDPEATSFANPRRGSVQFGTAQPPPLTPTQAAPTGETQSAAPTATTDETDDGSISPWWWLVVPIVLLAGGGVMMYLMNRSRENKRLGESGKGHGKRNDAVDDAFGDGTTPARPPLDIKMGGTDINKGARIKPHDGVPEVKVRSRVEPPHPHGSRPGEPARHGVMNSGGAQQGAPPPRVESPPPVVDVQQAPQGRGPLARPSGADNAGVSQELIGDFGDRLEHLQETLRLRINALAEQGNRLASEVKFLQQRGDDREIFKEELQKTAVQLKAEMEQRIQDNLGVLMEEVTRQRDALNRVNQQNTASIQNLQTDVQRRELEIKELRGQMEQQGLYTKIIETIIKRSEEKLGSEAFGNIAREAGEQVNIFFREEVATAANGLGDLPQRADAIHKSLHAAVERMRAVDGQAEGKLGPFLQRAREIAAELRQLQDGLNSRELNVKLDTTVPIGQGAREPFLERLSRAVRREVDKLRNPREHYERKLDLFVKGDILNVVDICDKEVTKPGANADAEAGLRTLFETAGLKQILPKKDDPFKPAEQDVIQMVSGGTSDRIARVVSRGFYYQNDGREQLVRKACVDVYR